MLALAARQHGVVSREQALAAGMTRSALHRRVAAGGLRVLHRGVYVVGPLLTDRGRIFAAVLACGPRAVLSHRSAAMLWLLLPLRAQTAGFDVTVVGGDRRRPGIVVHRVRTLRRREVTRVDGIPVTSPARTLLDIAAVSPERELEQAVAEALARRLTTVRGLQALASRNARRIGAARLLALLRSGRPARTRSAAEEDFLSFVRRLGVQEPLVDVDVAGVRVDFFFPSAGVVVEIDGYAFHSTRWKIESDHRRDATLAAAGFHVVRVTWRELTREPELVAIRLDRALRRRAS